MFFELRTKSVPKSFQQVVISSVRWGNSSSFGFCVAALCGWKTKCA